MTDGDDLYLPLLALRNVPETPANSVTPIRMPMFYLFFDSLGYQQPPSVLTDFLAFSTPGVQLKYLLFRVPGSKRSANYSVFNRMKSHPDILCRQELFFLLQEGGHRRNLQLQFLLFPVRHRVCGTITWDWAVEVASHISASFIT